jgi:hypothetical protein
MGLPAAVRWTLGAREVHLGLAPAIVGTCGGRDTLSPASALGRYLAGDLTTDFVDDFADEFESEPHVRAFASSFGSYFATHFSMDVATRAGRSLGYHFALDNVTTFASSFLSSYLASPSVGAFPKHFERVTHKLRRVHLDMASPSLGHLPSLDRGLNNTLQAKWLVAVTAEAWAGLALGAAGGCGPSLTAEIAVSRVHDRWALLLFEPLAQWALALGETPERVGLLLALGLFQLQTTWRWPGGPTWARLVDQGPLPDPFAAAMWHWVRAVQDPDQDAAHGAEADACLDRMGWPELAEPLKPLRPRRISAETLASYAATIPE